MSKQIKKMQMDALKQTFGAVRDLVLLSISGVPAFAENQLRLALRKRNIRLQQVKNSLAAIVFEELGIKGLDAQWTGPTTIAWGSTSIADLSKEIDAWLKKPPFVDKIKPKVAVVDGAVVSFEEAKKYPTRAEALARVVSLALAPASTLVGQLRSPGAKLAGLLKALAEKEQPAAGAEAPAAAQA
jgi:large subunit ribosomal protein L10